VSFGWEVAGEKFFGSAECCEFCSESSFDEVRAAVIGVVDLCLMCQDCPPAGDVWEFFTAGKLDENAATVFAAHVLLHVDFFIVWLTLDKVNEFLEWDCCHWNVCCAVMIARAATWRLKTGRTSMIAWR